jgi:hypothetical protein
VSMEMSAFSNQYDCGESSRTSVIGDRTWEGIEVR